MNKLLTSGLLALLIGGCAAEPESGSNGTCSLSCSKPVVGSNTFRVRRLTPAAVSVSCVGDFNGQQLAALNGPIQVRYQIYEPQVEMFPTDPAGDGNQGPINPEQNPEDNPTEPNGDQSYTNEVPRPGIGFEPSIFGLLDAAKSNDEFKTGTDGISPFKYAGIVTSSSEWCSDSCGVMTYEFWPDCKQNDTSVVSAGIAVSGGVATEPTVFSFEN